MGRLTAGEYGPGMADDVTHYDAVEAYCDQLSYLPGEGVGLHVWCATELYASAVAFSSMSARRYGAELLVIDVAEWFSIMMT